MVGGLVGDTSSILMNNSSFVCWGEMGKREQNEGRMKKTDGRRSKQTLSVSEQEQPLAGMAREERI